MSNLWVYWPVGTDEIAFGPVEELDKVYPPYIYQNTIGYTPENPPAGWYRVSEETAPKGYRILETEWVLENGVAVKKIKTLKSLAEEAEEAAAVAAEDKAHTEALEAARIAALAESPAGAQVQLLKAKLLSLGFEPPYVFTDITQALLTRYMAGQLTEQNQIDMLAAMAIYKLLKETALSDEDIRAIREYIESQVS